MVRGYWSLSIIIGEIAESKRARHSAATRPKLADAKGNSKGLGWLDSLRWISAKRFSTKPLSPTGR